MVQQESDRQPHFYRFTPGCHRFVVGFRHLCFPKAAPSNGFVCGVQFGDAMEIIQCQSCHRDLREQQGPSHNPSCIKLYC